MAWVDASAELVARSYAGTVHNATRHGRGLIRVTGPHGGALLDLVHLVRLTLNDESAAGLVTALECALGGTSSEVSVDAQRLDINADGRLCATDTDGDLVEVVQLSPGRLAGWRAALRGNPESRPKVTFAGEGTIHRLQFVGFVPGGSAALVGRLRTDLGGAALATGNTVQVLGGDDMVRGVQVWLEGDLTPWRALALLGVSPEPLAGLTGTVSVESRPLAYLTDLRRDDRPWPIEWSGGGPVRVVQPGGPVSAGQLRLLAMHLEAAFGADTAWVDDRVVRVSPAAPPERVLEMVVLWAQRAWVQPQAVAAG